MTEPDKVRHENKPWSHDDDVIPLRLVMIIETRRRTCPDLTEDAASAHHSLFISFGVTYSIFLRPANLGLKSLSGLNFYSSFLELMLYLCSPLEGRINADHTATSRSELALFKYLLEFKYF